MAALTPFRRASLLLALGILALSCCAVICAHGAGMVSMSEGTDQRAAGESVTSPQVCICSPKAEGQKRESPECQCTDLSILDKLLFPEDTASSRLADVSIAGHQSSARNASKELTNNTSEPSARVLSYKSARAVFFEHFSPFKHTDKSLAEPPSADSASSNGELSDEVLHNPGLSEDRSPPCSESTAVATREEGFHIQKHQTRTLLNMASRARALYRLLIDYFSEAPWSVALLSMVITVSISWGMNKLVAKAGFCKDLKSSDGCPECQLRQAQRQEYVQRRLEGKHGVPARPAASDKGPRVPIFDSDDEGVDPTYAPDLSQASSSDWDSDESSGDSCEILL